MGAAGPAARREEGEYSAYLTDEQRSRRAGSARFGDGRLFPRAARSALFSGHASIVALAMVSAAACRSGGGSADAAGTPGALDAPLTGGGDDGGAAGDGGAVGLSRSALLGAFGACVQGTVRDFLDRAGALQAATAELAGNPDPAKREAAREAFRAALDVWEVAEMMQIGPAAEISLAGGQNLREQIYFWPYVNACAAEGELVARGYESPGFPTSLANRRGLGALEYLLFYEGNASQCAAGSATATAWAALAPDEREARRRAYAAAAAAELRRQAAALADAWEAGKGNFAGTLAGAGPGNRTFPTTQAALNAVSDAILYLDNEVKDMKVAHPVGLRDCPAGVCLEQLESKFAGRSKANLRANLTGLRRIAEGCGTNFEGLGFDDLLEAVGAGSVASRLRERIAAAHRALDAIEEPDLKEAIVADPASVRALHAALKDVTDVLKTEFLSVLDLEIPKKLEGDND